MSRRTAEIVKNGALLCASLLVTVLASELALRATGYRPALADPAMYVANDDEHLPYRMRPYYEGYYMGEKVRLDADGYRVFEADTSGTQTVLLLGDSVVFGHGLAEDEAPAAQVQDLFAGRSVRVRSAAVSGYTSWNELAALERYVARHDVDAVVLVYLENDITFDHNQLRVSDGTFGNIESGVLHRATQAMYRNVYLSYLLRNTLERAHRMLTRDTSDESAPAIDEALSPREDPATSSRSPLDSPAFDHSLEALLRMEALCAAEDVAFTVGIYRDVTYYDDPERVLQYEKDLSATLAEHGIHSFVIRSHVEQLDRAAARLSWNDPHPTADAVGIFVRDIARAVSPLLAE